MNNLLTTRRILGLVFLLIACVQVAVGLTVLKDRLGAMATLLYWVSCLLATCGALLCAMLDAMRCLGDSRREQRNMLEQTLREIDEERARRNSDSGKGLWKSH